MASTNDTGLTNAVRINCSISQKMHSRPIFESVTLSKKMIESMMSPGMLKSQSSQIARRIGTPLRAVLEEQPVREPYGNMDWSYAVYLHMCCNLDTKKDSATWGWAPDYWRVNAGDAYVIREDAQPLSARYLEAFCAWCFQELQPRFEIAMEEERDNIADNRKNVLAMVTKEKFEAYREKFDREKMTADYNYDPMAKIMEEYLRTQAEDAGKKEQA
ncbi:unnamed protein product [Aureobasidium pullulans]|nr:hypothetical protein D6D05_05932 [Aureobasidium pullulans]CAD0040359.1 unnamed protein product [Aureobasidium pullulans]